MTAGIILGILIYLAPWLLFPVCKKPVETAAGTLIPMACFWVYRYTSAIGVLIVIVSALTLTVKDLPAKRAMFIILTILGVYTALSPMYTFGIPIGFGAMCLSPQHMCRLNTMPALFVLGSILAFIGLVATVVQKEIVEEE